MENKDLVKLLLKEIKEMSLLCESLSATDIQLPLLLLSKSKVESMSEILTELVTNVERKSVAPSQSEETLPKEVVEVRVVEDRREKEVLPDVDGVNTPKEGDSPKEILSATSTKPKEKKVATEEVKEKVLPKADSQSKSEEEFSRIKKLANATKEKISKLTESRAKKQVETLSDDEEEVTPIKKVAVQEKTTAKENKKGVVEKMVNVVKPKKESDDILTDYQKKNSNVATVESRFVRSLKLSLGDRYLYQRELFDGDMSLLNQTMQELDKLSSLEEALEYVERFGWDDENEATVSFMSLLHNRFS